MTIQNSMMSEYALPLFDGYAAQQGVLDPALVSVAESAGGYLGDELRYGAAYIFWYRYPKGLRTIGALPVGLTDISWRWFTVLNSASAITWAVLLVGAGYAFGEVIEEAVTQGWGAVSIALLLISVTLIWLGIRNVSRQHYQNEIIDHRRTGCSSGPVH